MKLLGKKRKGKQIILRLKIKYKSSKGFIKVSTASSHEYIKYAFTSNLLILELPELVA